MSSSTQRKTTTAAQAKVDPKETIYERVQLLQKADAQLKLVIGKIRPHPTKLECAEAFDPLLELADNLRADIDAIDMGNVMRKMLLNAIAPCGDSLVLEGWTWEEIKAKDFKRKRRVVSLRMIAQEDAVDTHSTAHSDNKSSTTKTRRAVVLSEGEESDGDDVTISAGAGTPGKKKRPRRK